ncbi:MAG: hypothetical protein RLP98_13520 [Devosia sp.]
MAIIAFRTWLCCAGKHPLVKRLATINQIAECDENLCGPKLSPSEKALFTRRRKEAYEALHGSAKANSATAANIAMGNNVNENLAVTFTTDTAAKTGQSERLVQLNAERGEKIDEESKPPRL